jgi:TolA-binding protein
MTHVDPISAPEPKNEMEIARDQIQKLQEKVQDLETRLSALNDKINLENGIPPSKPLTLPNEVVTAPAASARVIPTGKITTKKEATTPKLLEKTVNTARSTPKSKSFASDEAVDRFREAKILFDTKRFSDAVVEFSDFLKNEPDHPLAASAQYYLGMSYLEQKEYKLAEDELSRVLLSYSHSGYIPDTLLALSRTSEALDKPARKAYFREKLLSQFPNSPQAKGLSAKSTIVTPTMVTSEEPKVIENPKSRIDTPQAPEAPTLKVDEHQ